MSEADHDPEDRTVPGDMFPAEADAEEEGADPGEPPEQQIFGLSSGQWLVALVATAVVCTILAVFIGFFVFLSMVAFAGTAGVACFWLRLAVRWAVLPLMAVVVLFGALSQIGPFAVAFHQAGLPVVNALTDYEDREFWYDYEKRRTLPGTVCREKGDELECIPVTTREELMEELRPVLAEEGGEILEIIGGIFFLAGFYLAVLSAYTQLFMGWPARTERLEELLDKLGSWDRNGIRTLIGSVVVMGPGRAMFGAFEFLDIKYNRGGGITSEYFALLWPSIILDKVNFLATAAFLFGLGMILLGGPARRAVVHTVFAGWNWGWEGKAWVSWMAWGLIILPTVVLVPVDFVVKTVREIAIATTIVEDLLFLRGYHQYPGWLQAIYGIEDVYPFLLGAGLIILVGYFFRFLIFWAGAFTILGGAIWLALQLFGIAGGHVAGPVIVMGLGVFLLTLTGGYEPSESTSTASDSGGSSGSDSGSNAPDRSRDRSDPARPPHPAYLEYIANRTWGRGGWASGRRSGGGGRGRGRRGGGGRRGRGGS